MLWFVSGILLLRFIWFYRFKEQKVYVACFYGIGTIFEISQLSEKIPGTFDFLDLLFMGIGAFVEGLLYNIFVKRRFA
jgi:glycopeptide antibiotics resistance protein